MYNKNSKSSKVSPPGEPKCNSLRNFDHMDLHSEVFTNYRGIVKNKMNAFNSGIVRTQQCQSKVWIRRRVTLIKLSSKYAYRNQNIDLHSNSLNIIPFKCALSKQNINLLSLFLKRDNYEVQKRTLFWQKLISIRDVNEVTLTVENEKHRQWAMQYEGSVLHLLSDDVINSIRINCIHYLHICIFNIPTLKEVFNVSSQ